MFRLRLLRNGLYQIHSARHINSYEGTPTVIFKKAIQLGIQEKELAKAVNEILEFRMDYANFSAAGKLIATKRNNTPDGLGGWQ